MTNIRALVGAAAGLSTRATTGAVQFDGSTHLERGADLTGNANSDFCTFSFWGRYDDDDNDDNDTHIFSTAALRFRIRNSANGVNVEAKHTSPAFGSADCQYGSSGMHTENEKWHHYCGTVDTNANSNCNFFVDDVKDVNYAQDADGSYTIGFVQSNHAIGGKPGSSANKIKMSIYEYWIGIGVNLQMDTTSNRRKFINADLTPVSLGSDGSTPTGTAPLIYMSGGPSEFVTNKGSGGNFSVTSGALIDVGPPIKANAI